MAALGLGVGWNIQLNELIKVKQLSLRFQNLNSETGGSFKTKVHMKAYGRMRMKIDTNELSHMTKMVPITHIWWKSSSPE